METGPLWGLSTSHQWIPFARASDTELWCFLWSAPEQTVEQTIKTLVIWLSFVSYTKENYRDIYWEPTVSSFKSGIQVWWILWSKNGSTTDLSSSIVTVSQLHNWCLIIQIATIYRTWTIELILLVFITTLQMWLQAPVTQPAHIVFWLTDTWSTVKSLI